MWNMARFYIEYQSNEFLQPLVGEISWSKHIVILTKCKETRQRQFYILATKKFGWTKDVLINKIEAKTFENYLLGQSNFDITLPDSIKNQAILALRDEYTFDVTHRWSQTCRQWFVGKSLLDTGLSAGTADGWASRGSAASPGRNRSIVRIACPHVP